MNTVSMNRAGRKGRKHMLSDFDKAEIRVQYRDAADKRKQIGKESRSAFWPTYMHAARRIF